MAMVLSMVSMLWHWVCDRHNRRNRRMFQQFPMVHHAVVSWSSSHWWHKACTQVSTIEVFIGVDSTFWQQLAERGFVLAVTIAVKHDGACFTISCNGINDCIILHTGQGIARSAEVKYHKTVFGVYALAVVSDLPVIKGPFLLLIIIIIVVALLIVSMAVVVVSLKCIRSPAVPIRLPDGAAHHEAQGYGN